MDETTLKRHRRLQELQRANIDAWRGLVPAPDPSGLDANLKKNTGFIKKCKANLGPDSAAQLVREATQLKLEKYVSEIVPAVLEGLQRCRAASEFTAAIDVISALHARFPVQFTVPLVCQALKQLAPPSVPALIAMSPEQRERDEQARLSRQRPTLRVLAEMYVAGLLWGLDAQPGGAGGVDLAAALALSHPAASSGSGKLAAKMKEAVQQPGHCVLVGVLQTLLLGDREYHLSIMLATIFAKALRTDLALGDGEITDSCVSNVDIADAQDLQRPSVVSADACRRLQTLLHSYLDSAVARLQTLHRGLVKMRESQEERLFNKGVVHADAKARLERHTKAFDKLSDSVGMLCEALGRGPPALDDGAADDDRLDIVFGGTAAAGGDETGGGGLWEDDEERVFYVSLIDLRSRIPSALLESSSKRQGSTGTDGKEQALPPSSDQTGVETPADSTPDDGGDSDAALDDFDESALEASMSLDPADIGGPGDCGNDDDDESSAALGILEYQQFVARHQGDSDAVDGGSPRSMLGASTGADGYDTPGGAGFAEAPAEGTLTIVQQAGSADGAAHMLAPVSFAQLLRRLPTMTTKDDVDQAAVDFCYVNTRANRKALASALLDAPRRQMFVIPLYGRFLATLHPFFPDIGEAVVAELTRDFGWLARKRFKGLLDAQLKNTRYIAELTKFGVAPLHVSFCCARTLLEQFHVQNIEVLCALLDGCGRFLRAQPKTAARIEAILEILMRKRRVLNLDDRTMLLIENAYNACQLHRVRTTRPAKFRTPYERYIRKLVYEDLASNTISEVCQALRKLPWGDGTGDDPQRVRHALICCFSKAWKIKHANIRSAAAALGVLGRHHPWFRVAVVDAVTESIVLGLERSVFDHNQRRITEAAYVGELFGRDVVGAKVVLDLVRLFLVYGHRDPRPLPGRTCDIDPSSSYFRIRLICTLLLACGRSIGEAAGPAAMADLSVHLQMYILAKDQPLPVDIDYSVDGLFDAVFAAAPRLGSWGEAAKCAVSRTGQAMPAPPPARATPEQHMLNGEAQATTSGGQDAANSASQPGSGGCSVPDDDSSVESDDAASVVSDTERLLADMDEAQRQREALDALLEMEEEESLEREFNKLMLESSDLRRADSSSKLDVGIPMSLIGRPVMRLPTADQARGGNDGGDAIRLSLLTGKKQRPVVHELDIPAASRMAQSLRQHEESAMREKAHLKRIVLDYERREAEEERRQYKQALAARRAAASTGSSPATRPVVPGATFVNRPSLAAARRQRRVTGTSTPNEQQPQQQQRAGAFPSIPDHFR